MRPLQDEDPRQLGGYRLLARLGEGGMGVVLLGRSPGGRLVAVKLLRDRHAADPQFRARFRREVAAARTVTSTCTAPVLDADPQATPPWLVTGYLPGLSLREAVGVAGALPPPTLRVLVAGLAEALAAIHLAGLAHRDLKPGNVMLTATEPRVIDFGIARPDDATAITRVGDVVGTPGFMAPEQVLGGLARPASDVFALGAVLAFAATGRLPFGTGPVADTLLRVRQVRADLAGLTDPWLLGLITSCLRADPSHRPTAAQLAEQHPAEPGAWLPPVLTEEIDRRAAQARELAGTVAAPPESLAGQPSVAPADATMDPVVAAPAEPRVSRRQVVTAGVIALAGAAAAVTTARLIGADQPVPGRSVAATAIPASTSAAALPTATVRWSVQVSGNYPEVLLGGGVLVARLPEGRMVGLDPRTGAKLWEAGASLLGEVSGGRVYVAESVNTTLTVLDAATGHTEWEYHPAFAEPPRALAADSSVVCFGDKSIRALEPATRATRWTAPVDASDGLVLGGGVLVAVADRALAHQTLAGLDAGSGRLLWRTAVAQPSPPTIRAGVVYFADAAKVLHAIHATTGKPLWQRQLPDLGHRLQVSADTVYLAGGDRIYATDAATGARRWTAALGPGTTLAAASGQVVGLAGDTVYFGTSDHVLHAVRAADGTELWTCAADTGTRSGPVVADGLVHVGTRAGRVEALVPPAER